MKLSNFRDYAQAHVDSLPDSLREQFDSGTSVLVTGGTGLVGQAFVWALDALTSASGGAIYLVVRNKKRAQATFKDLRTKAIHFISFDEVEPLVVQGTSFSHIVHMASPATPHDFNLHIMDVLEANVNQTNKLLEVASAANAHFVMASTLEIYGNIPLEDEGTDLHVTEEMQGKIDNLNPRSIYPETKRLAENLCAIHTGMNGGRASIARISHTFGPGFAATDDRVQNQFIRKAAAGQEIVLQSDGSMRRTYTYSLDVASALLTIMARPNSGVLGTYNIAAEQNMISIRQLAEFTLEAAGQEPGNLVFDIPEGQAMWSSNRGGLVPECTRLRELGWEAKYSVLDGMRETIALYNG